MLTLFDLPGPEKPEYAVIAHYLSDDQYGSRAERQAFLDAGMEPTLRSLPFRPACVALTAA
ncbi:hypothetical protein ACIBL8_41120 [Streptomyces sp. NPDC050523]|uniref:hypothetical protein n=1 Tax=Streptomyces sp. NPDC050523 TaxID=3365622 RepID=UPI00379116D4